MRFEEVEIRWTRRSINHIARHGVQPYEVEECLFENAPIVMQPLKKGKKKDRYMILCQCPENGRYLFIVTTKPDKNNQVRVITARNMNEEEKRLYWKRRR